ncbi:hypothetical protein BJV74DRAFT_54545 [Russula compacta]|nr:hypothetical protein BJV74DRAFT_54545 [Russula compacta]
MGGPDGIILPWKFVVSTAEDVRYLLVRDVLQNALGALHRAPSLHSLTLSFNPKIWEMYPIVDARALSQCLLFQREVLSAMAQNPNRLPALQSLTINNWLAVPDTLYAETPFAALQSLTIDNWLAVPDTLCAETPFARIVASLRHLRFLVCVDGSNDILRRERFSTFWKLVVEQKMLVPARRLESLDVDCNMRVKPPLNFNLFTYPRLTALSLGNIIWEDGSAEHGNFLPGVENFVVRHGKRLRELKLCRCTIEIPMSRDAPFRSWAAIWNRFADELTELVDLVVEFEADPHREDRGIQYSKCYGVYGYASTHIYQQVGTGADAPALEAFRAIVEARKSKSKLGRKLDE